MKAILLILMMFLGPHGFAQAGDFSDRIPYTDDSLNLGEDEQDELFKESELSEVFALDDYITQWLEAHPELIFVKANSRVKVDIDQQKQRMTVFVDGEIKYKDWKVSTGKKGLGTTPNGTFTPFEMNRNYHSRRFKVILPNGIKFQGGNLIHAASKGGINYLGQAHSHGCVRLHPVNARKLYDLVSSVGMRNTKVVVHR